jgi:hypothetical protein
MIIHENLNQLDTMLSPLLDFFYQVKVMFFKFNLNEQ